MQTFFTSDTHFWHDGQNGHNIITLTRRPYTDLQEMHEKLIENWNNTVQPEDTIYHLGDFSFKDRAGEAEQVFKRLNGHKHLVRGNHDSKHVLRLGWESINDYLELQIKNQWLVLFHYAIVAWHGSNRNPGSILLHGHHHGTLDYRYLTFRKKMIDVGVDSHAYVPLSFENIIDIYQLQEKT